MLRAIFLFVAATASGFALSAQGVLISKVEQILVDNVNYGECMALVNPGPQTITGTSCNPYWVTFSCSGDFNSKTAGSNKFSSAQLALITAKNVRIQFDDTKKHNGYCFAQRIDNYQ